MSLKQLDPQPDEDETSTLSGTHTPPETIADVSVLDSDDPLSTTSESSFYSIPWPGSTFIISNISSGEVLTLDDGQITLSPPGGRGSYKWECIENRGWLGFRNPVSGKYLGYEKNGNLVCYATRHQEWENFCARQRPDGGYVLLMTCWDRLHALGVRDDGRLSRCESQAGDGIRWYFSKTF